MSVSERPFGQPALVNRASACLGPPGFDQAQQPLRLLSLFASKACRAL